MSDLFRRAGHALSYAGLTMLLVAPPVHAQDAAAGLPAAADLIARYAKAVGGDVWKQHKSARMKATMEVPTAGMSATMEVVQIFPNAVSSTVTLGGLGEIKQGYDGTTAWSVNPMTGPQVLTGAMADAIKEQADPENSLRTSANIVSSETLEKTTINGQDCYRVKHTWKSGSITTDCFAVSDGLLIATTAKASTPMGEVEGTTYQSEYKDFGGMKRPTKVTSETQGQRSVMTMTSWEWDVVDPKEVVPPPEITALIKKP